MSIFKARVEYEVTDASAKTYSFPFPYLRKEFIKVSILHTDNSITALTYGVDYSVDNLTITLVTAPSVSEHLIIYRETTTDKIITWNDGSILLAKDMNTKDAQMLHLQEEQKDYLLANALATSVTGTKETIWSAQNHRITDVSDPKEPQDAVTKHYMESVQDGFVSRNTSLLKQTTTQATNAKNSASSSATSASNSASSASASETSNQSAKKWAESTASPDNKADTDSTTGKTQSSRSWALYSKTKAQEAATSASTATTQAGTATTQATNAKNSASQSAKSASASATSASNAKTSETNAKASETQAGTYASSASSSASASAKSANNAKTSETNAANSAKQAAESAGVFQDFQGATASTDGNGGKVPKPLAGEQNRYLKGDGTWVQIEPLIIAMNPVAYYRDVVWSGSKTTLVTPNKFSVNIGGQGYLMNTQHSLSINDSENWDKADFATPANRKGKDFYIYACQGTNYIPKIVLSNNSTVPENYTALTSRKIGGFHCECADVGTISNHPLSGYVAGDILPASVWDLHHRPISAPEGMVFTGRIWVDIYLPSWDGSKLVSEYNNVICDGAGAYPLTGTGFAETFAKINKRLLSYDEMSTIAKGIEEGVNIKNSADPNTTGGHVSTTGRRMISNIGCEDCTGVLWQWLSDLFGQGFTSGWVTNESTINTTVGEPNRGSVWGGSLGRLLLGGSWADGSPCGSRAASVYDLASRGGGLYSARGASEPLIRKT